MDSSIVYFVQSAADGPVKIGTTRGLTKRMKVFQNLNHDHVAVLRTITGSARTEKWFHDRYSEHRLHGEWFSYHPDMLTDVPPSDVETPEVKVPERSGDRSYPYVVTKCIMRLYSHKRGATKLLSIDGKVSPRTAESWLAGVRSPCGEALVNLMAANSELHDEILRLVKERQAGNKNENKNHSD